MDLDVREPAPGVRRFTVPLALPSPDHLHVHVLDTPEGDLVVDCGAVGSEDALSAGLEAVGAAPSRVLLTHGHVDHWGLATTLQDTVLAHPRVGPSIRLGSADLGERRQEMPAWLDVDRMLAAFEGMRGLIAGIPEVAPLADGDRLGDWEVLHTPGHDPGHVCLFREADGVLLCGDLLLRDFTPNVQPDWSGADALADFLASLDRIAALDVRLVLPSHGPLYEDATARVRQLHDHHARRLAALMASVEGGPRTLRELRAAAFGQNLDASADRMLAAMETFAHIDHLRRRGDVRMDLASGTWSLAA
ncbi:MBL fold metallo-hydrolase [Conexibacter sp. SYSU D00693]|uniref:MBL fold metallo-hydrolase n=1 Tax=Conexibacter sp. SYSU D00693 TaxID=2812560 RepID=UPI00196A37A2|nr:MBL fold metallo-hydrolase [Conexibacter sp. SYSU D00693]